jgi:hypothetical protein
LVRRMRAEFDIERKSDQALREAAE